MQHVGLTVQSGPFAGLTLIPETAGLGPKLLGTFELEVWSAIDRIISGGARHVVNIGTAEGYYVIGLLRCLPAARGTAFETLVTHREGMKQMAQVNQIGLHRLEIHGTCDPPALREALKGAEHERTVAVIDVEGAERELLNVDSVRMLRHVFVLVEIHDFIDPQISTLLRDRFRSTHTLTVYRSQDRRTGDLPSINGMPSRVLRRLAQERRPTKMEWFWFAPSGT